MSREKRGRPLNPGQYVKKKFRPDSLRGSKNRGTGMGLA